jgi:penicillin-binding protein 1B
MVKRLLKWSMLPVLMAAVALSGYGWYLSTKIEKRFSGRRWQVPSTVYSDAMLLYPGQRHRLGVLKEKLRRLGYREVARVPDRSGDMRVAPSTVDLFLHDLSLPGQSRPGFAVRIRFQGDRIAAIERRDRRSLLPILELEPEEIGRFYGLSRQRRELVSIERVPPHLVRAVLAAEDARFYDHYGFDPLGMLRALWVNLRHGAIRQGGSTITQQLAKNYFLTPERTLGRKFNELMMAVVMEFMYRKDEILEIYLNEIYLGQIGSVAVNGVGEAALFYFGKPVDALSPAEAATLAGLIRSPGGYSPFGDRERCRRRRDAVLQAMQQRGWLTNEDLARALASPLEVVAHSAPVQQAPYFMDFLAWQLETLYSPKDLSSLGLSVYTTLDTRIQTVAERALANGLARLEREKPALRRSDPSQQLQGAIVVMQPKTGYLLAMVGGRNYAVSQYNRITQSRRQPGSAFKPFVYLAALDDLTPAARLSNAPRTYTVAGKPWQPENFSDETDMAVSMRTALARSYNRATVDLAMRIGLDKIVATARQFQFTTPMQPYPSLALGAFEVVPMELARAYCVFGADGVLPYPMAFKDVVDENRRTIKRTHMTIQQLISPGKAYIIADMLRSVTAEGTARSLAAWNLAGTVAGKTGTTNNYRDAWFVGFTPSLLALVWVGFDNGDSLAATGASAALPIWAELLESLPEYVDGEPLRQPPDVVRLMVCSESGMLAQGQSCPQPVEEVFLAGHAPTEPCPLHPGQGPLKRIIDGFKHLFNG